MYIFYFSNDAVGPMWRPDQQSMKRPRHSSQCHTSQLSFGQYV